MLSKFEIMISQDETEKVDTLSYAWRNLLTLGNHTQNKLFSIQETFKTELLENVKQFKIDTDRFVINYRKVCKISLEIIIFCLFLKPTGFCVMKSEYRKTTIAKYPALSVSLCIPKVFKLSK